jgi:hypothetical protein
MVVEACGYGEREELLCSFLISTFAYSLVKKSKEFFATVKEFISSILLSIKKKVSN